MHSEKWHLTRFNSKNECDIETFSFEVLCSIHVSQWFHTQQHFWVFPRSYNSLFPNCQEIEATNQNFVKKWRFLTIFCVFWR